MSSVQYTLKPHDGGWAYTLDGVFSETYPSHDAALKAVRRVAAEQRVPGETAEIEYQAADGTWHIEHVDGGDRPEINISG